MTSYYANGDLEAYTRLIHNYDVAFDTWGQLLVDYETAHAGWEEFPNDPLGNPAPEPQPPDPALEPTAPPAPLAYEARVLDATEELETAAGPVIVTPPSIILTGPDGNAFAVRPADLAAFYTDTSKPLPSVPNE